MRFLYDQFIEWSQTTIGTTAERDHTGAMKHLKKEIEEILKDPSDPEEWVDALFLLLDGAFRAGHSYSKLVHYGWLKLKKLRTRKYPKVANGEACEHVRD